MPIFIECFIFVNYFWWRNLGFLVNSSKKLMCCTLVFLSSNHRIPCLKLRFFKSNCLGESVSIITLLLQLASILLPPQTMWMWCGSTPKVHKYSSFWPNQQQKSRANWTLYVHCNVVFYCLSMIWTLNHLFKKNPPANQVITHNIILWEIYSTFSTFLVCPSIKWHYRISPYWSHYHRLCHICHMYSTMSYYVFKTFCTQIKDISM